MGYGLSMACFMLAIVSFCLIWQYTENNMMDSKKDFIICGCKCVVGLLFLTGSVCAIAIPKSTLESNITPAQRKIEITQFTDTNSTEINGRGYFLGCGSISSSDNYNIVYLTEENGMYKRNVIKINENEDIDIYFDYIEEGESPCIIIDGILYSEFHREWLCCPTSKVTSYTFKVPKGSIAYDNKFNE